jgi:eukaryotic-like serine/threonine-protein kinase
VLDLDVTPKYEPVVELGRGGMGKVLLARSLGAAGFERLVALKRMNAELLESDELVRRFVDEARLAAYVRHANVVSVHHFGRDEEGYYLVLDYVEGVSLESLIERCVELGTRPSPPIVLRVIADALAGLQAVHEAKDPTGKRLDILHRDVSTQNVLVGCDGLARLSDFGIAKSILATHKTAANRLVGKLLYMTPEYLRQQAVNRTLDVYAMGMTMWIALAAVDPWPDLTDAQLVTEILHGELPKLSDTGARIATGFDHVIRKACARDPAKRYPTASAMGSAIAELGRSTGWMASHTEVAEFVEELCGDRLERLRSEVRDSHVSLRPPAISGTPVVPSRVRAGGGETRQQWSVAGAQRIRVAPRNPEGSEGPTLHGAGQAAVLPSKQATKVGIGPQAASFAASGRGGTKLVPELARAPATAVPAVERTAARAEPVPPPAESAQPVEDQARRARARRAALILLAIVVLLLAAAAGAWASRSAHSRQQNTNAQRSRGA